MKTKLVFKDLPKVSNNKFYAGMHWVKRKELKDNFSNIIAVLTYKQSRKRKFTKPCRVKYIFEFVKNPLDASNCVGMLKMIEDVLFPDDSPKIIKGLEIISLKSKEDKVIVIIETI